MNDIIKPGVYRHFKGSLYTVIGECIIADTNPGILGIIYTNDSGDMFVRSLENWVSPVVGFKDGKEYMCERFRYIES